MSTFSCVFVNMCNYTFSEDSVVPIGQLSLATLINRKISEATASVIDLNYVYSSNKLQRSNDLQTMITESAQFIKGCIEPKLISLYTMCNTYHYAIMLAYELKRLCPTSTVCLAGLQASIVARETLESYPSIDFIAIGEGELTIESIIQGVKTDDYSSCKGIAYRKNDTVIVIPNDELLQNLDDLPFIDYDFLNFAPHDIISIEVGRGCPYSCIFCSTNDFWKRKYRIKSPARIFSEISFLYYKYGIKKFGFEHDLFLINKRAVLDLCELIVASKLNIKWGCSSRLDCIDEELISKMAEAGCYSIFFGIETGSLRMQKAINKNLNLSLLMPIVSKLKRYNIAPTFSFIYGFPDETIADIEETLKLMYCLYEQYRVNFFNGDATVQLHKLMFLPGTKVTSLHENELIPLSFLRTDVQHSETHWNNPSIMEMLRDKAIFPQFYGLPQIENSELSVLDAFFASHLAHLIEYLDCTYKALLLHFIDHINIFFSFIHMVSAEKLNTIQAEYGMTIGDVVDAHMRLFKEYIDQSYFDDEDAFIRDVFSFEYTIYCQAHSTNDFDKTITFSYDVISMKKTRVLKMEIEPITLHFIKNKHSSRIIKELTNQ